MRSARGARPELQPAARARLLRSTRPLRARTAKQWRPFARWSGRTHPAAGGLRAARRVLDAGPCSRPRGVGSYQLDLVSPGIASETLLRMAIGETKLAVRGARTAGQAQRLRTRMRAELGAWRELVDGCETIRVRRLGARHHAFRAARFVVLGRQFVRSRSSNLCRVA